MAFVALAVVVAGRANAFTSSFSQINWLGDSGGFVAQNSEWGLYTLTLGSSDLAQLTPFSGGFYGFLNVGTISAGGSTQNWAVQNHLIWVSGSTEIANRGPEEFTYNLTTPRGVDVGATMYAITITPGALGAPNFGNLQAANVGNTDWLFGGLRDDGYSPPFTGRAGQVAPNIASNYQGSGTGKTPDSRGVISIPKGDIAAINEDKNGCAPGSAARSVKYLEESSNGFINTGLTAQQIYEQLKAAMSSSVGTGSTGTKITDMFNGKRQWVQDHNLPISTRQISSIADAMAELANGQDVESLIYWGTNADGESMGGHAAFTQEIVALRNAAGQITGYEVKICDDPHQGNGSAENHGYWLSVSPSGALRGYGTGASVYSFMVECPTPEPGAWAAMLTGGAMMGVFFRRRARK